MKYLGKKIWITGAASGIGKALALAYAGKQATLILSDRDLPGLRETEKLCAGTGGEVVLAPFDLAVPEEIAAATAKVLAHHPKIDILISNGGISQRSLALETPIELDRRIMEVNFFGAVELTKALLPALIANGGGHIAVTSSMTGKFGFPLRTAYCASKHAIQGYFEALRAELYSHKVGVTIISPGRVYTNISVHALDKDGKQHGVMDPGQANGISAEKSARIIIRAIQRKKKEVFVGGFELIMIYIRKFLTPVFHILARKINPT
ncbi:MAG: SDR family NAD(P)-dependent oxidoreductase [Bacteroidales bacterium]|nr:SDR family NAD(P)-dependent oxidoreductase [Bacteroidales bacterium]